MNDDALVSRIRRDSMPVTESGCWIWMKCVLSCGYGQIVIARKPRSAHRTSYEVFRGPIPEGLQLDHLCRVRMGLTIRTELISTITIYRASLVPLI